MKTDKRINEIVKATSMLLDLFDKKVQVADIATDHGYIAEKLASHEKVEKVFATDISEKCLDKTRKLIKNRKINNVEAIVGDGLNPIGHVDVAVIAGIGGYEIVNMLQNQNMLSDNSLKCRYFVLQPAQNEYELRKWIFDNKILVFKDFVIEDADRFYPIIVIDVLKKQRNKKSIFNLRLGRDNHVSSINFRNYLLMLKENLVFVNNIKKCRIWRDKVLFEKYKLYHLIEKLLKS